MKDAYYFPHDYNAKDDPKCERLLYEMGQEGYGIFWTLIEVLRAQPDYTYPMANLPIVARKYNADEDKLRRVIDGYGLFVVTDDQHFCSESLNRRMEVLDNRRRRQSEGGKNGNAKRWAPKALSEADRWPVTDPADAESLTDRIKEKESKVNHKRESEEQSTDKPRRTRSRERENPPTVEEVEQFFDANGYTQEAARKAYAYYADGNWRDSKGNPVLNWKQKCRAVWFKPENEVPKTPCSGAVGGYAVLTPQTARMA